MLCPACRSRGPGFLDHAGGRALQEELAEHPRRLTFRGDCHAESVRPRQAAAAIDCQRERREPGQRTEVFGYQLVERQRVAEGAAARMRGHGEEADVCRVTAVHTRMRHAAHDGEIGAVLLEQLQVRRERVVTAIIFGEERLRQQAEVVANAKHPPRRLRRFGGPCEWCLHRFQ